MENNFGNDEIAVDENLEPPSPSTSSVYSSRSDSEHSALEAHEASSRKSEVHKHFNYVVAEKKYTCKYCKTKIAKVVGNSTSNMRRHLERYHKAKLNSKLGDCIQTILKYVKPKEEFTQIGFEERLMNFVVTSSLPFNLVENESFQDLVSYCNPRVKFIGDDTAKRRIVSMFQEEKNKLKSVLDEHKSKISFVLDCWTSANQVAFQGIIGRWIDKNWTYQERIIDLDILNGKHTGQNLCWSFEKVLEDFNLKDKIIAITTDNASNCDTFFDALSDSLQTDGLHFDKDNQRVRCLAHIINLACQDALATLKSTDGQNESDEDLTPGSDTDDIQIDESTTDWSPFERLRKGIMKIRKSTQHREMFRKHCEVSNVKYNELVKDVPTRWNSTYFMLKRAVKMKLPFDNTLRSRKDLKLLLLTDQEWAHVSEIVKFLKPFKKMTTFMSHDKIPTISLSVMVYMELYNHLESVNSMNGYSPIVVEAARKACGKLNKYYPSTDSSIFVIGTVLDPRCKLTWYSCNSQHFPTTLVKQYRSAIKHIWETQYKPPPAVTQEAASLDILHTPEDLFASQMKKAKFDKRDELKMYLGEAAVGAKEDSMKHGVLTWWKARSDMFPNLSRMAKDYLAVSGTGVPIERFFSNGTDLLSPKRQSMHGDTIKMCMCLQAWLKSQKQEEFKRSVSAALADKLLGNSD